MHEMSLMHNVVNIVLSACEGKPVERVRAVYLSIGEGRDVVDEYVPGLFAHLARGTVAADAKVFIRHIPLAVQCNHCEHVFPIDPADKASWSCPACGAFQDYQLFSGDELLVDRIDVEWDSDSDPHAPVSPAASTPLTANLVPERTA